MDDGKFFDAILGDKSPLERMFIKRENLVKTARNFLDEHTDKDGKISQKHAKTFEEMEGEIKLMTTQIENEMARPLTAPVLLDPNANYFGGTKSHNNKKFGVTGKAYQQNFFEQFQHGFKTAQNVLQESVPTNGGYLIPTEFHDEIITALTGENVLRQISRVITTSTQHEVVIQATAPTADFIGEGQNINLSTETFNKKTIGAYKLAAGCSVTNELLADSFYDIEQHLLTEFSKAIGTREENAFLNGDGNGQPLGILLTMDADTTTTITSSGTAITADDVINLAYSLKRPYRKNACWLMNDTTLAEIRKLKDATQNYIWTQNLLTDDNNLPSMNLLGFPVYTSEYMPSIESEKIPILFGDFTRFIIGQRGEMTFKPLHELHALQDLSTYLLIERIDGVLADSQAIKGLKMK